VEVVTGAAVVGGLVGLAVGAMVGGSGSIIIPSCSSIAWEGGGGAGVVGGGAGGGGAGVGGAGVGAAIVVGAAVVGAIVVGTGGSVSG